MNQEAPNIAREAVVSALINGVLSALFFVALFHGADPVGVWGAGGFAADFVPQSFMVGLMGALVPGLIARKAVSRLGRPPIAAGSVVRRAIAFALASVVVGAGLVAAALWLLSVAALPFTTGLLLKISYGVLLSFVVTPVMVRSVWG